MAITVDQLTLSNLLSKSGDIYPRMHSQAKNGVLIGFIVPNIDWVFIL